MNRAAAMVSENWKAFGIDASLDSQANPWAIMSSGNFTIFFERKISCVLIGIAFLVAISPLFGRFAAWRRKPEVAPADDFGRILQSAHIGNEVEGGINGSADESFAADGGANCCNRDYATQPRHRPQHLARDPALPVLKCLPGNAHNHTSSKGHSGRAGE